MTETGDLAPDTRPKQGNERIRRAVAAQEKAEALAAEAARRAAEATQAAEAAVKNRSEIKRGGQYLTAALAVLGAVGFALFSTCGSEDADAAARDIRDSAKAAQYPNAPATVR